MFRLANVQCKRRFTSIVHEVTPLYVSVGLQALAGRSM
jgi:hypothetical protein